MTRLDYWRFLRHHAAAEARALRLLLAERGRLPHVRSMDVSTLTPTDWRRWRRNEHLRNNYRRKAAS